MEKILTEKEYNLRMEELGFVLDEELDKFFIGDSAFLGNVDSNVCDIIDLLDSNDNKNLSYFANVLINLIEQGAKFVIGEGAIDDYGIKKEKALYCTNYREIISKKEIANKNLK